MDKFDLNCIEWQEINSDGTKYSLLEGSKETGQVFSYAFYLPAGTWDKPHWHTGDARIYVIKGELLACMSDKFEPANAKKVLPGEMLFVTKNTVHFDGAQIDTTVFGVGVGPWATHYK